MSVHATNHRKAKAGERSTTTLGGGGESLNVKPQASIVIYNGGRKIWLHYTVDDTNSLRTSCNGSVCGIDHKW